MIKPAVRLCWSTAIMPPDAIKLRIEFCRCARDGSGPACKSLQSRQIRTALGPFRCAGTNWIALHGERGIVVLVSIAMQRRRCASNYKRESLMGGKSFRTRLFVLLALAWLALTSAHAATITVNS